MRKKVSQAGFFNARALLAFALCSAGGSLAMLSVDRDAQGKK
jgi:hypothetical protein